ncbi:MAG: glycosyltransferase family 4 protein [Polyangiaceae bacterium]|jgi:glycosyltransferase involved in cell wall biosynthesis|nr:glycosyltransferase family 4 protein [Polyangiaceae bacterium]
MSAATIAFHCGLPRPGQTAGVAGCWGPPSLGEGIGGSEEAAIHLARELAARGHAVTVFNPCGPLAGEYDGVVYRPEAELDGAVRYDVLVSWRRVLFVEREVRAGCKVWWLHDSPKVPEWFRRMPWGARYFERSAREVFGSADRVAVLSQFHRGLLADFAADGRVFVTRNGVHLPDFDVGPVRREPRRVIYPVCYARGLEHLLRMWPAVRAEVPDAELHAFYGWHSVLDPEVGRRLRELVAQPGVFEHGQVGHRRLAEEYLRAGIFAYPSHTPEVFSISTLKAQLAGCVPIVTATGALPEVARAGVVVPGSGGEPATDGAFQAALIELLRDVESQERLRADVLRLPREAHSWARVAEEWERELVAPALAGGSTGAPRGAVMGTP